MVLFWIGEAYAGWPWEDSSDSYTRFMRFDTHTVNGQLGYVLNTTISYNARNVSTSLAGSQQVWFGFKAWKLDYSNTSYVLTDGYNANVTRTVNGEGLQTISWTPDTTSLDAGDALKVSVCMKLGSESWSEKAVFVTETLVYSALTNNSWSVKLYTNRTETGGTTYAWFFWGDTTYQSRIEGVELSHINPWEKGDYYLRQRDFVSWLLNPWTHLVGNFFYGVVVLFVEFTLYNKYEDIRPPAVFFWLFAGTNGILIAMIPLMGLHLAWFLLAFVLATMLYLLLR